MYQLNEYQASVLRRLANGEEPQLLTVVSPNATDDEKVTRVLNEQRNEALDLQGLGFIRNDSEDLIQIATAVSIKLGRPTMVFTITSVGRSMFQDTEKRPTN